MRTRMFVAATVAALATLPAALGSAQEDTDTSFELLGGTLSVSTPAAADLGSAPVTDPTLDGLLGTVTVDDDRGAPVAEWTTTVSSTNFTTGAATANETVLNANVAYSSGAGTPSGTGLFAPGLVATLAAPGIAGAWAGTGTNSVSWDPTITVTVLPGRVAGIYTGTITHSVL